MRDIVNRNWPTLLLAAAAFLSLAGCTYTEASYGDAKLVSWRMWTDTSASLSTGELTANYSSDADTAAAMTMNRLMLDALLAGGRLVAPGP